MCEKIEELEESWCQSLQSPRQTIMINQEVVHHAEDAQETCCITHFSNNGTTARTIFLYFFCVPASDASFYNHSRCTAVS